MRRKRRARCRAVHVTAKDRNFLTIPELATYLRVSHAQAWKLVYQYRAEIQQLGNGPYIIEKREVEKIPLFRKSGPKGPWKHKPE